MPTMMGTQMPPMLPPRFITPPRKPTLLREPRIDGMHQYRPHQRRKNSVDDSSATTMTGSLTYATEKIDPVATTAAMPNSVRITTLGRPPALFHLSASQPPTSSP